MLAKKPINADCRMIWPMGAELAPAKAEKFLDAIDYVAEVKISGERITITKVSDTSDVKVRLFTRSGSKAAPDRPIEVTHRWPRIQTLDWSRIPIGTVLDGEGFSPIRSEQEIAGLFNHRSSAMMPDDIKFIAWDCVFWGDDSLEDDPWFTRRNYITHAVELINNPLVELVVVCHVNKREFYETIIENGGEGVVLKHINGKYYQGKKPANVWVKAKRKDTYDCIITGFKDANPGKYEGLIGSIELSQYQSKGIKGAVEEFEEVVVCYASGINDDLRREITANPRTYLRRVVVVDAYARQKGSITLIQPRIKYIRPEGSKDPRECRI